MREERTMTFPRRGFLRLAAGAVALAAFAPIASAQTYPSRPITIVVPIPAAGPADVLARILAERMRETPGQPVVIDDVTGAAGSSAAGHVERATRGPRDSGRPLHHDRQSGHQCRQWRYLSAAIRPRQGLRTDLAIAEQSSAAGRQQGHTGKGSARADRTAQGKPRQGDDRQCGA